MVRAVMDYTRSDTEAFCKKAKSSKDIIIFYASLFLLYSAGVIGFGLYGIETYAFLIMISVQAFIFLMFLYLVFTVVKAAPDRELEKIEQKYGSKTITFTFDDESFTLDSKNKSDYTVNYADIKQLIWTDDHYFIICPEKDDDYIIRKSAVADGKAEELENIFKEKLSDKIKRK